MLQELWKVNEPKLQQIECAVTARKTSLKCRKQALSTPKLVGPCIIFDTVIFELSTGLILTPHLFVGGFHSLNISVFSRLFLNLIHVSGTFG